MKKRKKKVDFVTIFSETKGRSFSVVVPSDELGRDAKEFAICIKANSILARNLCPNCTTGISGLEMLVDYGVDEGLLVFFQPDDN